MTLQVQVSCSCSLVVTKTTFHYQYMVSLPLIWLNAMGVCLTNMLCYFIINSISSNCMKSMRMPPIVTNAWSVCLLVRFGPLADHAGVINNFIVLYNRAQYKNGWTDRDAIWALDLAMEPCSRLGQIPRGKRQLCGTSPGPLYSVGNIQCEPKLFGWWQPWCSLSLSILQQLVVLHINQNRSQQHIDMQYPFLKKNLCLCRTFRTSYQVNKRALSSFDLSLQKFISVQNRIWSRARNRQGNFTFCSYTATCRTYGNCNNYYSHFAGDKLSLSIY